MSYGFPALCAGKSEGVTRERQKIELRFFVSGGEEKI